MGLDSRIGMQFLQAGSATAALLPQVTGLAHPHRRRSSATTSKLLRFGGGDQQSAPRTWWR